jgi:hypothetical protein
MVPSTPCHGPAVNAFSVPVSASAALKVISLGSALVSGVGLGAARVAGQDEADEHEQCGERQSAGVDDEIEGSASHVVSPR